jgi:MoaA/NifB/PqqE/SkfB family radical SAM enzyme
MLIRLAWRGLTEVSWRLAWKAGRLWVLKGLFALRAFKKRLKKGELFPPFLFFAVTNACNLRCRGCWISNTAEPQSLSCDAVSKAISEAAKQQVYFHTLLGGEPFLYPDLWKIIARHPECYFQIITNGQFFDDAAVRKIKAFGNVSPLVSIDGRQAENDHRRGTGTYQTAIDGCRKLQNAKILYGAATVVTGQNWEESLTEEYVRQFIGLGAMYLWFYIFRPVGENPSPELCVNRENMKELRKRLLKLRRKMPIILIDTYWDANGEAVCPAAKGLGFHIGPQGGIEPCPPLSAAKDFLTDHAGDLFKTINESTFLRQFQEFAVSRTKGCVILESPKELAEFFRTEQITDTGGRGILRELEASVPRTSHHLDGEEIPEDFWLYRILKKTLFFGMGGYG